MSIFEFLAANVTITCAKELESAMQIPFQQAGSLEIVSRQVATYLCSARLPISRRNLIFSSAVNVASQLVDGGLIVIGRGDRWPDESPLSMQFYAFVTGGFIEFENYCLWLCENVSDPDRKFVFVTNVLHFYSAMFRPRIGAFAEYLHTSVIDRARGDLPSRRKFLQEFSASNHQDFRLFQPAALPSILKNEVPQRILIVLDDLSPQHLNTLTKLVLDWAYLLTQTLEVSIGIFVSKPHLEKNGQPVLFGVHDCSPTDLATLFERYGFERFVIERGQISLSFPEMNNESTASQLRRVLISGDWDCAVTFPTINYSLSDAVIRQFLPTVSIEIMTGLNFSRNCDVYIPNGNSVLCGAPERDAPQYFPARFPQIPFPIVENLTRSDLGIPADVLVIVSAGVDFERRMDEAGVKFWTLVFGYLAEKTSACWIMIGIKDDAVSALVSQYRQLAALRESGRLIFVPYASDLRAVYRLSNIYVHPPISGGGRGVALAASECLAILATRPCDSENFLHPDCLFENITDTFSMLDEISDVGEKLVRHASLNSDAFGAEALRISALDLFLACKSAISKRQNGA